MKGNVKVDWYKGDELLEDAGHVVIVDEEDGETFSLALEEASEKDSGMYKCVATNEAGTVTSSAVLIVEGGHSEVEKTVPTRAMEELPVSKPTEEIVGKAVEIVVEGKKVISVSIVNLTL